MAVRKVVIIVVGFVFVGYFLVLSATTTYGNVSESATFGPVPTASLAEVARLREAVVVVVTEFGVEGVASGTFQSLVVLVVVPPPGGD